MSTNNQAIPLNANPSSHLNTFAQTLVLRKGEPPLLISGSPDMKVFGVIE